MRENEALHDERYHELIRWLEDNTQFGGMSVEPASADASFRRYFRLSNGTDSWIAMDAPPDKEDSEPFVRIAGYLREGGVRVPVIYVHDLQKGFMVLEDFGGLHLEDTLARGGDRDALYDLALESMSPITKIDKDVACKLPPYDRKWLTMELMIFHEWFLGEEESSKASWLQLVEPLLDCILEQPSVFVHRDFHGRNLLLLNKMSEIGVIDFQGAFYGPLTYDLGSLLKDCYQDNPLDWVQTKALQQKLVYEEAFQAKWEDAQFLKWMDWTGLQRHLKVLGLFQRLYKRDGKDKFLKDLPQVWKYTNEVLLSYPELSDLREWLEQFEIWNSYQK